MQTWHICVLPRNNLLNSLNKDTSAWSQSSVLNINLLASFGGSHSKTGINLFLKFLTLLNTHREIPLHNSRMKAGLPVVELRPFLILLDVRFNVTF